MRGLRLSSTVQGWWLPTPAVLVAGEKGDIPGDTRLTQALSHAGAYDRQTFPA